MLAQVVSRANKSMCNESNPYIYEILQNSLLIINTLNRSNLQRYHSSDSDLRQSMSTVNSVCVQTMFEYASSDLYN